MAQLLRFSTSWQSQVRHRQNGLCAECGIALEGGEEHPHLVIPAEQADSDPAPNSELAWLGSPENCVVLCHNCHERAHEDGKYWVGEVVPADYYRFSHGPDRAAHQAWVREHHLKSRMVWN
jgi:hypothetical protein